MIGATIVLSIIVLLVVLTRRKPRCRLQEARKLNYARNSASSHTCKFVRGWLQIYGLRGAAYLEGQTLHIWSPGLPALAIAMDDTSTDVEGQLRAIADQMRAAFGGPIGPSRPLDDGVVAVPECLEARNAQ
jgi:hypothetical protein